jgi:hypothetical protein
MTKEKTETVIEVINYTIGEKLTKKQIEQVKNCTATVEIHKGSKLIAIFDNKENIDASRIGKALTDDKLVESVNINGILLPALINKELHFIDGYCRTFIAMSLGLKIPTQETHLKTVADQIALNQSNRTTVSEYRKLVVKGYNSGKTVKALSEEFGISTKSVGQALKVDKLSDEIAALKPSFKNSVLLASTSKAILDRIDKKDMIGDYAQLAIAVDDAKKSALSEARAKKDGLKEGEKYETVYTYNSDKVSAYIKSTPYAQLSLSDIKNCFDKTETITTK